VPREPFIPILAAFAVGILLCIESNASLRELAVGLGCAAILAMVAYLRRLRVATWVAALTGVALLGAVTAQLQRPGPAPELDSKDGDILILSGCIVQPPVLSPDRQQFVLELEPGARVNVSLALNDGEPPPRLEYGQRIELDAKVRRTRNFENPGAFDYVRYLARRDVFWTASARAGTPVHLLPGACGSRWQAAIFRLRVAALERIERMYPGDSYASAMLSAILIGESSKLQKIWTEHFRRTGTYHALVISGLHIIVLAGTLLALLRLFVLEETLALAIACAGAWVYAAVSGWSAPVIRAASGFTLYLAGRYMFRRGRVLNLLALIAIVYLAADPGQIFEASFQLSFLSVAAIGAFASPLIERVTGAFRPAGRQLADIKRDPHLAPAASAFRVELRLLAETLSLWTRVPARHAMLGVQFAVRFAVWLTEMVILSAVMQVALALPMALYFHRISITGLTANLAVVPLMTALVPVGFAAILTGWTPPAAIARWLLNTSEQVAGWHAQFEPAHRVPDPPLAVAILLVAALTAVAITVRLKSRWTLPAVAAVLVLFGLMVAAPFPADVRTGSLELTALDVGQGDALLITTPEGKILLVDSGGFPRFGKRQKPNLDTGEDVVSPYLWRRRIQRADVLVTSHAHEDHVGGLKALLDNFHPSEIWTGALPENNIESDALKEACKRGVRVWRRLAGERFTFGGARFEVLAPARDYLPAEQAKNNDSLAFRISFGRHSFLLTGDIEREVEWGMLDRGVLEKTTVLKVAHHGSKTSSTNEFLDATRPEFAIVSAGYGNLFRHPHAEVLDRLAEHHTDVFRTDVSGLVTFRSDGRYLSIDTWRWERESGGITALAPFWD
jgi:competence protein ComEC